MSRSRATHPDCSLLSQVREGSDTLRKSNTKPVKTIEVKLLTSGETVNHYAGLNGSFADVALRVLPIDAEKLTHVAMGWHPPPQPGAPAAAVCGGDMAFSVFPVESTVGSANLGAGAVTSDELSDLALDKGMERTPL